MNKLLPLHYQKSMCDSDKLLLCLHGNSTDSNYFETFIHTFEGWNVVAPDYIGHGKSPRLEPSEYNYELFIQCLVELLNNFSYKKLVIIGHSMGGNLAIELMKMVKVDGLLLLSAAPISYTSSLAAYLKLPDLALTNNEEENLVLIEEFLRNFDSTKSTMSYLKKTFSTTDPAFRDRLLQEFGALKFSDHLEIVKQNKSIPVGCIIGLADTVVNNEYLVLLNSEGVFDFFAEIQGAGHYSLLEKPKESYDLTLKFLERFT